MLIFMDDINNASKEAENTKRAIRNCREFEEQKQFTFGLEKTNMVFLGKTYVSPYNSQRSHPSMDLGVKWDLCVLFVQTVVKCQDCKFV